MRFFPYRISLLAVALTVSLPPDSAAQPVPSRVVAHSGQVVPAMANLFDTLYRPTINDDGQIAFRARLEDPISGGSRQGIWLDDHGVLNARHLPGPLAGSPDALRDPFEDPTLNSEGRMVFGARFGDASPLDAIWLEHSSSLVPLRVLAEGDSPPAVPAFIGRLFTGASHEHVLLNDDDQTLFVAELEDVDGLSIGNSLWLSDGFALRLLGDTDSPVPSLPGATYSGFNRNELVLSRNVVAAIAGVTLADGSHQAAVLRFEVTAGSVSASPLAVTGSGVSGLAPDEQLGSLADVSINRSGQIAFRALVHRMTGSIAAEGVWLSTHGTAPSLLYRRDIDPAADGLWLSNSRAFALLDDGRVAVSTEEITGQTLDQGLYLLGSGVETYAKAGQPAPDLPGLTFETFGTFSANPDGRMAFLATVAGPGVDTGEDQVLVAEDEFGSLRLVAREGGQIELSPGDTRTISGLTLTDGVRGTGGADGRPRGFGRAGGVVWRANFEEGGIAILVTELGRESRPELYGLEVVQTLQNWSGNVNLYGGKPTLVRAHLRSEDPMDIDLVLRAHRNGSELPGSPMFPSNFPLIWDDGDRGIYADSVNWDLPDAWTETGHLVRLTVERIGGPLDCREQTVLPDDCQVYAFFIESPEIEIRFVAIDFLAPGGLHHVDRQMRADLIARLRAIFPVAEVSWTDVEIPWPSPVPPTVEDLLGVVGEVWASEGCYVLDCDEIYYGVALDFTAGAVLRLGLSNGLYAAGWMPSAPEHPGRHTMSHEIAHVLGESHAVHSRFGLTPQGAKQGVCGSVAHPLAPDFPNYYEIEVLPEIILPMPTLGPMESGEDAKIYGWDSGRRRVMKPERAFELMSYCATPPLEHWISDWTYASVHFALALRALAPEALAATGDVLWVRGLVDQVTGDVDLEPVSGFFDVPVAPSSAGGSYTLRVVRQGGAVEDIPFEPAELHALGPDPEKSSFGVAIDPSPAPQRLEIRHQGMIKAERIASTPPTVRIASPNGGEVLDGPEVTVSWQAIDPDGDALTHTVQWSADGGQSWRTLVTGLAGDSVSLRRQLIRGSEMGLFRVISSDGMLAANDISDATLTVADNSPTVELVSPRAGAFFEAGQSIVLEARAFDTEDGVIATGSLKWSSDLDGVLGIGQRLIVPSDQLSAGLSLVTVAATDSHGGEATATRAIRVRVDSLFRSGFEGGDTDDWSQVSGLQE